MGIHTQGQPTPSDIYQLNTHHEYGYEQALFPPTACICNMLVKWWSPFLGSHIFMYIKFGFTMSTT